MRVFFDTEFTQFRDGELLSIGLATDADDSLVVEVHDAERFRRASDFCRTVVIPQFGSLPAVRARSDVEVGLVVADWLAALRTPLTLCYDFKLDWFFLERALFLAPKWRDIASTIAPLDIASIANFDGCLAAQEAFFVGKSKPGRHHALIDALALRERWREYERLTGASSDA